MMTDILGSAKNGAADAASSTKQAVSGRNGNNSPNASNAPPKGFSDALSNLNRDEPQQDAAGADEVDSGQQKSSAASSSNDYVTTDTAPRRTKPIIDIRPESLRRAALEQQDATEAKEAAAGVKANEPQMTSAEKKLREALAAAKAITQKSDAQTGATKTDDLRAKHAGQVAKDDTQEAQTDDELDQSMLAADDAKIADMLSLLGGKAEAGTGQVQIVAQKEAGSQSKHDKDDADIPHKEGTTVAEAGQAKRLHLVDPSGPDPLSMPPDAEVPGTKQFRFSNARGEGQSISMTVAEGAGDGNKVEFKQGSNGAAENVTVVDSRRFIGLAPNSNGANLTALMSGDSEWAAAMQPSAALSNAAAQSSTGGVVNMLKLQMNPHDLGSVMATLRLHGEELNVHLTVETRAAYRQLSEDSGGIVDALRAQGFAVDQVTISIAPTADSDTNNSQQGQNASNSQTGQQQSTAEGGRQGQAADRGQQQASNRQPAEDRTRITNDAVPDNSQTPASGGTRPDQLYL